MRSHVDTVVDGDCRNATRRGKNPDLSERFHFWESVLRDPLFSGGLCIDFILFFIDHFFVEVSFPFVIILGVVRWKRLRSGLRDIRRGEDTRRL